MMETKMKKTLLTMLLACAVIVCGICGSIGYVEAKQSNEEACKAYAKFLAKHPLQKFEDGQFEDASFSKDDRTYVNTFWIEDLDSDGTPELVTFTPVNFRWFIVRFYQYKDNKVTRCKLESGKSAVLNNCATANGAYAFSACKNGHIHNVYQGEKKSKEVVYQLKDGVLKKVTVDKQCKEKKIKEVKNTVNNRKKLKAGELS